MAINSLTYEPSTCKRWDTTEVESIHATRSHTTPDELQHDLRPQCAAMTNAIAARLDVIRG